MPEPSASKGPLSHLKVLDLSRILAAPWATQILADMGADVIKVERPGAGDDTRTWGPPFLKDAEGHNTREAAYYLAVNRGKRSITVSIDTVEGQEIIRSLVSQCDVLIENYKTGTLERYGLDYKTLCRLNPRLIYCSVTGFGQTGPRKDQPAYDFLIQAMGGLMSVTGERDGRPGAGPQKIGVPIIDLMTGMYACAAILGALAHRTETGQGEYIDIAMLDVQVATLANQALNFLVSGKIPRRNGNAHPNIQPQDVYACADGDVIIVVGNDRQFVKLCQALGQPDLAIDERFAINAQRVRNIDTLSALLRALIGRWKRADFIKALDEAGVPCGPINNVAEVFQDPQVQHRGLRVEVAHPSGVMAPLVGSPIRFTNTPTVAPSAPPLLGQHTDVVLAELGYHARDIERLRSAGAV